ncbi:hypothetical protein IDJ75_20540 [Mucilaginibacter rigui]|uniref:Uncharacterized protein n=1 Tax=Mucilaginibacter rigui TaxID=534635 RepID=A0ABR7XAX5_9SPHI|nr:hypothetical protein [Mucilaginibacter rigui]MBD1387684.1 hypothetical protein [Mucilaginibacter rigui]
MAKAKKHQAGYPPHKWDGNERIGKFIAGYPLHKWDGNERIGKFIAGYPPHKWDGNEADRQIHYWLSAP